MSLRHRMLFGNNGGCFFLTTSFNRQRKLLVNYKYYQIITDSIKFLKRKYKFKLLAYVIMESHLHLILFIPKGVNVSGVMRDFKKFTSFKIREQLEKDCLVNLLNASRVSKNKKGQKFKIWQDRFDDLFLTQERTFWAKFNYIHSNPVKAGFVDKPEDYPYSSAKNYILGNEKGILRVDKEFLGSGGNS